MTDLAPYERLVVLAERETALVAADGWEDLADLAAERAACVAALPPVAPPEAAPLLHRLVALQAMASGALTASRAEVGRELGSLGRGRSAVRGYAASAAPRG